MVDVYRELGLDRMIETFVISAELGCAKPDPRMYRTASDGLQLDAGEYVFVDDSSDCLAGAAALGYLVCGMARRPSPPVGLGRPSRRRGAGPVRRYGEPAADGNPWVGNLDELRRHLDELRKGGEDS
jgi:FMN phosphatase YigB (HAD superfamily)